MGLFGDIFGGVADLFGAGGENDAAKYYGEAAAITKTETGLKEIAANRQIYQTLGTAKAAVGASGLAMSGTAMDVMRSSIQQGGLAKAIIAEQGKIEADSYLAQQQSAEAAANAQTASGIGSILGGVAGLFGI